MKYNIYKLTVLLIFVLLVAACNDFLDREPLDEITAEVYFDDEAALASYAINCYGVLPVHSNTGYSIGIAGIDNGTDNQITSQYEDRWVPGEVKVGSTGGAWDFEDIRTCNYFLELVVPKWKNGEISGSEDNVAHYIGEMYFFRAYNYFSKLTSLGDFPIVKTTLADDSEILIAASKRSPRNEVARFILSDLDSAIMLLQTTPPNGKNRISQYAAQLFKSRVALFEASWETYFKGTAFVPGGTDWPGEGQDSDFSINIDEEIDFFLDEAMEASLAVAENISLVSNTKEYYEPTANPYYMMFADFELEGYSEVLLWKDYEVSQNAYHNVNHYINRSGGNTGYTRGLVDNFLMANGLPVYAGGAGYQGDDTFTSVKQDRDNRLQLFLKVPGELKFYDVTNDDGSDWLETYPDILTSDALKSVTGYQIKKYYSLESSQYDSNSGEIGSIVFRAVEAYLNYIEASYLKNGVINATADSYWKQIRGRGGVNTDYNATINATVMSEEAKNDFAAYSGGVLLSDLTLYNIRRERRCELVAEGLRYLDLKRWRALDQLETNPYIVEGFKLWGSMQNYYLNNDGSSQLVEPDNTSRGTPNVSASSESDYLRPYRINLSATNLAANGYKWTMAHYLSPIAYNHFLITSENGVDASTSVIYQNPGWLIEANSSPVGY